MVCFRVMKELRERGYEIHDEKTFTTSETGLPALRPDIVALKDNHVYVTDIPHVYETSRATFTNAFNMKVSFHVSIVGSRSSFRHGQLSIWQQFGFKDSELHYLALNCTENSLYSRVSSIIMDIG